MKIVFFGTPEFAVPSLRALLASGHEVVLVVAQPDRPAGRGMKPRRPAVAELALEAGVPLVQPAKIRTGELHSAVGAAGPDLGVVVAYGRILPGALLAVPPHGFLNVHASLLPAWRGAAPIQRAIQAGETRSGVSIMRVDEELDHGPVFAKAALEIGPDERAPSLAARLAEAGGGLLLEVIEAIQRGEARASEQDHARASFAPKIDKQEGMVSWNEAARLVYDRFRAFDSWPGSFAPIGGETVKLTAIRPAEGSGEPGTILSMEGEGVVVALGEGALRLERLQRPGKREAPAADVLRGYGLRRGEALR
ncbi:MAG TPA: methionyl-tRNA formyltransferase [Thermoanaerobaculia bacterium]|nr:methionyl-tRNA formyltransferase [Thermoanaerobaculia bacterium]